MPAATIPAHRGQVSTSWSTQEPSRPGGHPAPSWRGQGGLWQTKPKALGFPNGPAALVRPRPARLGRLQQVLGPGTRALAWRTSLALDGRVACQMQWGRMRGWPGRRPTCPEGVWGLGWLRRSRQRHLLSPSSSDLEWALPCSDPQSPHLGHGCQGNEAKVARSGTDFLPSRPAIQDLDVRLQVKSRRPPLGSSTKWGKDGTCFSGLLQRLNEGARYMVSA